MTPDPISPRALRSVPHPEDGEPLVAFCGHCGRRSRASAGPGRSRVCQKCHLGLILQAPRSAAPAADDPFVVVDAALTVAALSARGEELLGVSETEAVNRHVAEFLVPAEAETAPAHNLAALITWAARGEAPERCVVVRPVNTFGVRYWARIAPCGPPRAALVVLADAR